MQHGSSRPRVPKGKPDGGQWISTPQADIADSAGLELEASEKTSTNSVEPLHKIRFKLLGKQRTIIYKNGAWESKSYSLLSSSLIRKFKEGLEPTQSEAADVAASVLSKMLNEGYLQVDETNNNGGLPYLQQPLEDFAEAAVHGAYLGQRKFTGVIPADLSDLMKLPETSTSESALETAMLRLQAFKFGTDISKQPLKYTDHDYLAVREHEILAIALKDITWYDRDYTRHGADGDLIGHILQTELPDSKIPVSQALVKITSKLTPNFINDNQTIRGLFKICLLGLGDVSVSPDDKQNLLDALEKLPHGAWDEHGVNITMHDLIHTVLNDVSSDTAERYQDRMIGALEHILNYGNISASHFKRLVMDMAEIYVPDVTHTDVVSALSSLASAVDDEMATENTLPAWDVYSSQTAVTALRRKAED